jgi:hypothetical protein
MGNLRYKHRLIDFEIPNDEVDVGVVVLRERRDKSSAQRKVWNSTPGTLLLCGNFMSGRGTLTNSATVMGTGTVSTFAASSSAQIFTGQRW